MKIAITPTVVVLEYFMFRKLPSRLMLLSVFVVCGGIAGATVMDTVAIHDMQVRRRAPAVQHAPSRSARCGPVTWAPHAAAVQGLLVGCAATVAAALYQVWAGSKQAELQANSSQLLHAYTPYAIALLGILVPIFEDVGWRDRRPDTLLGFPYSVESVCAIMLSAVLGIFVSLTTFLVIGTTSSLTYNIVSNLKTVIILTGGVFLFGVSWLVLTRSRGTRADKACKRQAGHPHCWRASIRRTPCPWSGSWASAWPCLASSGTHSCWPCSQQRRPCRRRHGYGTGRRTQQQAAKVERRPWRPTAEARRAAALCGAASRASTLSICMWLAMCPPFSPRLDLQHAKEQTTHQ